GEKLALLLTYSTDLFASATIERLVGHLGRLLEGVVAEPEKRLGEVGLLSGGERAEVERWNETGSEYPREETRGRLFARQALARPAEVAVEWAGGRVSYGELEERSNRLAQYLVSRLK